MSIRSILSVRARGPALLATLCLASCGGGLPRPEIFVLEESEAVRFLDRATFGAAPADVAGLRILGHDRWLQRQFDLEPSLIAPRLLDAGCSIVEPGVTEEDDCLNIDLHIELSSQIWWEHAVYADDQLRQRMALALSEILVVSFFNATLAEYPVLLADYYDTLALGAFGTYRELIEEVTLHPAMGIYLSMLRNRKEDPIAGTRPDENYARELMQLFSIGLVRLGPDGEPLLDAAGAPVPTYDQNDIEELSRVLTGWTFASAAPKSSSLEAFLDVGPQLGRMEPWPAFHDDGPKLVLDDLFVPAGLEPNAELGLVLDALDAHPNVAPFLSKQLIQRLVTSNPSTGYVQRVAAVWADNGDGVRGDLAAVARAILLDEEALDGISTNPSFGKVREPLLRVTSLWRAFQAVPLEVHLEEPGLGTFAEFDAQEEMAQKALHAPSVFNFFSPFYATTALAADGLVGPELQITTHATLSAQSAFLQDLILGANTETLDLLEEPLPFPLLQLDELLEVAEDTDALLDRLDVRLFGGTMASSTRDALRPFVEDIDFVSDDPDVEDGVERVLIALMTVVSTPDYLVQK